MTLVTGFLGAGKTTAIRHWLRQRPAAERWAVLVNDFGVLSVDAAAFEDVAVFEVAGGCACCAAAVAMRATLGRILRRGPWDRILMELSGLGHPATLVDGLREASRGTPLRVEGVVAVIDARRPGPWLDADGPHAELARAQVDCADAVVLNRLDDSPRSGALRARLGAGPFGPRPVLAGSPDLPSWDAVADAVRGHPSRAESGDEQCASVLRVPMGHPERRAAALATGPAAGRAPMHRLAQGTDARPAPTRPTASGVDADLPHERLAESFTLPGGGRRWLRSTPEGFEAAWYWPAEAGFDRRAVIAWARRAAASGVLLRGKGVFATRRDWYLWQHTAGEDAWTPTGWRRDNRIECLFTGPLDPGTLDALEHALLAAREPDGDPDRASDGASGGQGNSQGNVQGAGETPRT